MSPVFSVCFVIFWAIIFAHWLGPEIAICFMLICGVAISSGIQGDEQQ